MLIDLVRDHIEVVPLGEVRYGRKLLRGEDMSRGVRGVAEDEGLRVRQGTGMLELGLVEAEFGRVQLDVTGN